MFWFLVLRSSKPCQEINFQISRKKFSSFFPEAAIASASEIFLLLPHKRSTDSTIKMFFGHFFEVKNRFFSKLRTDLELLTAVELKRLLQTNR